MMAGNLTIVDGLQNRVRQAAKPAVARWESLTPKQRTTLKTAAIFLFAAIFLAYVLLPAMNARRALQERIPRMQSQLVAMRGQAAEVAALAKEPVAASAPRVAASAAALQSLFGPAAQITAAADGFRVVILAIDYASWWDKTGEAITGYGLVLRETSLVRAAEAATTAVAVDMRLTMEAGTAKPAAIPSSPGK